MENPKAKRSTEKRKRYFLELLWSLVLFILLLLPNYIRAAIQCLTQKPKDVRGKVVLITGTAGGLGRRLALGFHRLGARIVCVDINEEGNESTGEMIRAEGGAVQTYTVDITDKDNVRRMYDAVKTAFGPVDILVNNAAVVLCNVYANRESDDLVKNIIDVNVMGQFWMNKEILPSMLDRNSGQIVAISSVASLIGYHSLSAYTASKWAVTGMMDALDRELQMLGSGVVVTTVCPYIINSEAAKNSILDYRGLPILSSQWTCDTIIDGILKNKKMFTLPSSMYLMNILFRILPYKSQDEILNIFSCSLKYTKSDYETLKKYQRTKF